MAKVEMWFHSCTVYLVVTVFCLPSIIAQTIQPHILCANETAPGHSSGIIQYPPEGSDRDCTLTLTGFEGDYISLPKLRKQTNGSCSEIVVNSESFCIKDSEYGESAIIKLSDKTLNITLPVETSNFTELHYYNQVGVCGKILDLPDQPEIQQLSGVGATSYVPETASSPCSIYIANLPSPPVTVLFELLYSEGLSGIVGVADKAFSSTTSGSSLLADINGEFATLSYIPDGSESYDFLIRFQLLHCGDLPQITNSVHDTTSSPWLPGAEVTYQCTDGWVVKNNKSSTVECLLDRSREIAEWSDHSNILCVSVECPLTESHENVKNGKVMKETYIYRDKLQYECDVGYVGDVVVECTSNGSWSELPLCLLHSAVAITASAVVLVCVVVGLVCLHRKLKSRSALSSNKDEDLAAGKRVEETALRTQERITQQ